jgi:tyrosine-protein phosphatase YwqE
MVPIITHPERNQILLRRPDMVLQFAEQGWIRQKFRGAAPLTLLPSTPM